MRVGQYHQGMWDDDCDHEYSYSCSCECDHWCWHEYEYQCREYDCDCDGYTKESDDEGDDEPFTLKDVAVVAGGAALALGAMKVFGRKRVEPNDEQMASDEPPAEPMQPVPAPVAATAPPLLRSLPPAGWYQDGQSERSRWWDGAAWTDHFQPPTAPVAMAVPAGWYDDGLGHIRWWDGHRWTQHVTR